uniref:Uncharacterized protein n=1 Tax=Ditylenchus dipsaci TaxID=166011 RepID=A0A915EP70_9BILA
MVGDANDLFRSIFGNKAVVNWKWNSTLIHGQREQVLLRTNANIHKARNTLNALDEDLDLYKERAKAVIAEINGSMAKAVEQADTTSQAVQTQLQQALEVAEGNLINSVHSLTMRKAVVKAEQLVLEATIAKLNQQQAIQQHRKLPGKKENQELASIEKMAGFVVARKLANALQAIAQLKKAISMAESGDENVLSQSAYEATVTANKLEGQITQLVLQ